MNCYGTAPNAPQSVQNVNDMNMYPNTSSNLPAPMPTPAASMQNPYNTTTSGEWSQPIPTNPNMPTSPVSLWQGIPADQLPPTLTQPIYTPGYLMLHIGDLMRVEFLIGNFTTDRVGRLKQVGASFIVLDALDRSSEIVCDIYSIKFVTIIDDSDTNARIMSAF